MFDCIIIGVVVASANSTTIHYAYANESVLLRRDLYEDVAQLALKPRDSVLVVSDLGFPIRYDRAACNNDVLLAQNLEYMRLSTPPLSAKFVEAPRE